MNNQMKYFSILFTFILLAFYSSSAYSKMSERDLKEQRTCGDYKVKIYRKDDIGEGLLKIFKKNKEVYSEEGDQFRIGLVYENVPEDKLVRGCQDITGEGVPNLVVSHWSGGAHCCFDYYVFSLGKDFRLIDKLEADDNDRGRFIDLDHDGKLEFIANDFSFAYWHASFAGSPAPDVILRFKDGHYVLALDLMAKPLPSAEQAEKSLLKDRKEIARLCSEDYWSWQKNGVCVTPDVWTHMLDLIYTGHPNEAWGFLDKTWKGNQDMKHWFISVVSGKK